MTATRDELLVAINRLFVAVPGLLRSAESPDAFWPAFAGLADEILERAGEADFDWASAQFTDMLRHYKISPPEA